MVSSMKPDRFLIPAMAVALAACGRDEETAAREAAVSQRPSPEEIAAIEAETSYRAPESKNPPGVTEDDIVLLREGDLYKMGYVGDDGGFVEIPERGTLKADDSGFLPPFPLYETN